jgi:hypothetical protein
MFGCSTNGRLEEVDDAFETALQPVTDDVRHEAIWNAVAELKAEQWESGYLFTFRFSNPWCHVAEV